MNNHGIAWITKSLDALLPPLCMVCESSVGTTWALCSECWGRIQFVAPPLCACCGVPFEIPVEDPTTCASCLTHPPVFAAARAAILYDEASRPLILSFKHGDRTYLSKPLAIWMHRAGVDVWPEADVIVPVPLHRWRLLKRRYNQSALLAREIARLADKPVLVDALQRIRATPAQGHRNRDERRENVKGAFAIHPRRQAAIQGKTVVLIDDVLTTGATLNECARALLAAGAKIVKVLTTARVKGYD